MTITLLAAMGVNGEIGLSNGKLPWGSFKEELEFFKLQLLKELLLNKSSILVTSSTWNGLPNGLKSQILDEIGKFGKRIYIASATGQNLPSKKDGPFIYLSLGDTFTPAIFKNDNVVVLGGTYVYDWALSMDIVDKAIVSWVVGFIPPEEEYVSCLSKDNLDKLQYATARKALKTGTNLETGMQFRTDVHYLETYNA